MSLFQTTMLVLLCVCVPLNLLCVYMDRAKWINACAVGLCVGVILALVSDIISK